MTERFGKVTNAESLKADLCVVGAGAAGQTVARAALARGLSVLLLESGDQDFDPATQDLYAGTNVGHPYYELDHARLRFYGGTTNIWGGRCVPLDAQDFEPRSWVPHSGWPITAASLEPYYQRAAEDLGLAGARYRELWNQLGASDPFAGNDHIESSFWQFDALAERFGWQHTQALRQSPKLKLLLNANVTQIDVNADATAVTGLTIRALDGTQRQVTAGRYVLACGGIENPRLLLGSRTVQRDGVGNDRDQVGRYFMEHPHARLGTLRHPTIFGLWDAARKRQPTSATAPIAPAFVPSPAAQARHQLLNSAVTFKLKPPPEQGVPATQALYLRLKHDLSPGKAQRGLWHLYRALRHRYQERLRPKLLQRAAKRGTHVLHLILRAEQSPNPDSRVRLTDERDALGLNRVALDWRLTALDKAAAARQAALFRRSLSEQGHGTLVPAPWLNDSDLAWPVDPTVSNHPIGGYHHLGTTRMSADPDSGVVDGDCRVHGYRNLFIAGSSVFATAGWANPTLTIMALAHRLGDHLAEAR